MSQLSSGMARVKTDTPSCKQAGKETRQGGLEEGAHCLHHSCCFGQAVLTPRAAWPKSEMQDELWRHQGAVGKLGSVSFALNCRKTQQPGHRGGAVWGLWRVEKGPKVPWTISPWLQQQPCMCSRP